MLRSRSNSQRKLTISDNEEFQSAPSTPAPKRSQHHIEEVKEKEKGKENGKHEKVKRTPGWGFVIRALICFPLTYAYHFWGPGGFLALFLLLFISFDFINHFIRRKFKQTIWTLLLWWILFFCFSTVLYATFRLQIDDYSDLEITRLGAVSEHDCHIYLRYSVESLNLDLEKPLNDSSFSVQLFYQQEGIEQDWIEGPSLLLNKENDHMGFAYLNRLKDDTLYSYYWVYKDKDVVHKLKFSHSGRRHSLDSGYSEKFQLKTWPKSSLGTQFSFIFGSCLKPNFPFGQGLPGFKIIHEFLPDFLLFVGDFIYVDFNFNFGHTFQNYHRLYREVLGQSDSVQLFKQTPLFTILDDHELINNYEIGALKENHYQEGIDAYRLFLGNGLPKQYKGLYYHFQRGDTGFFVMDTRTYRTSKSENKTALPLSDPGRKMLGQQQLQDLFNWLLKTNETLTIKFLVTSVPFTYNWQNDDTWFGFQYERKLILDFIIENAIQNVLFLSGDRHQLSAVEFQLEPKIKRTPLVEFSVSPLNQFWVPFEWWQEVTSNELEGNHSYWRKDKSLFYHVHSGRTAVGRLFVDTETDPKKPLVIYCVFAKGKSQLESLGCGGKVPQKYLNNENDIHLLYRYVYHAVPRPKRTQSVLEQESNDQNEQKASDKPWYQFW